VLYFVRKDSAQLVLRWSQSLLKQAMRLPLCTCGGSGCETDLTLVPHKMAVKLMSNNCGETAKLIDDVIVSTPLTTATFRCVGD